MSQHGSRSRSPVLDESVVNCLKAVKDYRGRNISKWDAITQITSAITSVTASMDNAQRSTAGATYLAMLDKHDHTLARASARGHQGGEDVNEQNEEPEEIFNREAKSKHSHSQSGSPESK